MPAAVVTVLPDTTPLNDSLQRPHVSQQQFDLFSFNETSELTRLLRISNVSLSDVDGHLSLSGRGYHRCDQQQGHGMCSVGLILPQWLPGSGSFDTNASLVNSTYSSGWSSPQQTPLAIAYHAIVYVVILAYLLFGVSIITDRIVSTMEVIAAQKKTVTVKLKSGSKKAIKVPLWHPNVVALTVFAIGTSSQEIFVPIIEIFRHGFQADDLGPSLIVGSGAFHLFVITGVCLLSVREPQPKPINDRQVFFATAFAAIWAYLWIYLIVDEISPGEIEVWEALLTVLFFPATVFTSWAVAKRLPHRFILKFIRAIRRSITPTSDMGISDEGSTDNDDSSPEDQKRRKLATLLQHLKEAHPEKTPLELEEMAEIQMLEETPKSAAFYRLQATKAISGGANVLSKEKIKEKMEEQNRKALAGNLLESNIQTVGFASQHHSCAESCVTTPITLCRTGAGVGDSTLVLDYETVEGTAKANVNFEPAAGRITFVPGQQFVDVNVKVLDDGIYDEKSKFFKVRLMRPNFKQQPHRQLTVPNNRASGGGGGLVRTTSTAISHVELGVSEVTVSILDDDHCGVFTFEKAEQAIPDNIDVAKIKVVRNIGTKGRIAVPYRISPGTAKQNQDYIADTKGILRFDNGQVEASIEIKIIDKNRVGEVFTFYIELLQPRKEASSDVKNTVGLPTLADPKLVQIGICEDEELKDALDRLLKMTDIVEYVVSSTWKDQLREAVTVFHDDAGHIDSSSGLAAPSRTRQNYVKGYVIHALSLPWKLLVALVPPARLLHGWVAYLSLLALTALVAALIGDCASYLGCTIGLKDTVTAITLIASGMGLPDTFASRHAAMHEKTADAAIGHITGANAVSVFLGIGLSWTVGSIYQRSKGKPFKINSGDIAFSVMLYCTFASAVVIVLLLRRLPPVGGELGGPTLLKILSAMFFILLWVLFIGLSILESYCIIRGF